MPIKVVEVHGATLALHPRGAAPARRFYLDVLGLDLGPGCPVRQLETGPMVPASRGGERSVLALAVESLTAARAELDRRGIDHEVRPMKSGATMLLVSDPCGNLLELHQHGSCDCTFTFASNEGDYARVSGTVLFADMRGFTAVAERLAPDEVVKLLNDYFAMLTRIVAAHGGAVFHIAGDGLMAGFGVPESLAEASSQAVTAAREMIADFEGLAARWRRELGIETGLGIGINAGEVVAGNVGARPRASYTLIGDTVNVAARLVQRARAGEALFSRAVWQSLPSTQRGDVLALPPMQLRGRSNPVELYCIPAAERVDLREDGAGKP